MMRFLGFSNPENNRFGEDEIQEPPEEDEDKEYIDDDESIDGEISDIEPPPIPTRRRLFPPR